MEDSSTDSLLAALEVSEEAGSLASLLPPSLPPCPSFWQPPLEEVFSKRPCALTADAQAGGLAAAAAAEPCPLGGVGTGFLPPPSTAWHLQAQRAQ